VLLSQTIHVTTPSLHGPSRSKKSRRRRERASQDRQGDAALKDTAYLAVITQASEVSLSAASPWRSWEARSRRVYSSFDRDGPVEAGVVTWMFVIVTPLSQIKEQRVAKKAKTKIVRREYTRADVKELRAHSKAKTPGR